MEEKQEKRKINYRGLLLMWVAMLLNLVIFFVNPGSWQQWAMLGMAFIGLCHFVGALHQQGKWLTEQELKEDQKK